MPSVDVPAPAIGLTLNAAVVIVYRAVSPAKTPAACGVTARSNSWRLSTTRSTCAVRVTLLPPVALMVRFEVPAGVPADVATVSVAEPEPLIVVRLNDALAPGGSPSGPLSCTGPLKPPAAVTSTAYVVLWPDDTVWDAGVALSVNGRAFTKRVTVRCRTMRRLRAVMVSG